MYKQAFSFTSYHLPMLSIPLSVIRSLVISFFLSFSPPQFSFPSLSLITTLQLSILTHPSFLVFFLSFFPTTLYLVSSSYPIQILLSSTFILTFILLINFYNLSQVPFVFSFSFLFIYLSLSLPPPFLAFIPFILSLLSTCYQF